MRKNWATTHRNAVGPSHLLFLLSPSGRLTSSPSERCSVASQRPSRHLAGPCRPIRAGSRGCVAAMVGDGGEGMATMKTAAGAVAVGDGGAKAGDEPPRRPQPALLPFLPADANAALEPPPVGLQPSCLIRSMSIRYFAGNDELQDRLRAESDTEGTTGHGEQC